MINDMVAACMPMLNVTYNTCSMECGSACVVRSSFWYSVELCVHVYRGSVV